MRVIVQGLLLACLLGCSRATLDVVPTPPPPTSEPVAAREEEARDPAPESDLSTTDVSHHLALGYGFSCALRASREVVCWGRLPRQPFGVAPTLLEDLTGAIALHAGPSALCARFDDGHVACRWLRADDVAVEEPELAGASELTLTYSTVHAVVDGEVRHVSRDGVSDTERAAEIDRFERGDSWRATRCTLEASATVRCGASRPGLAAALTFEPGALAVANGSEQACVLRAGDVIECAGLDDDGQASGDPRRLASPVRIEVPNALAIAGSRGPAERCVLAAEGAVWCWSGAAGHEAPARVEGLPPIVELMSGPGSVLVRGADGSVHEIASDHAREVRALRGATRLGGGSQLCARVASGRVRCVEGLRAPVLRALAGASAFGATDSLGCGLTGDVLRCAPTAEEPAFTLHDVRGVFFGSRRIGIVLADGTAQMHRSVSDPEGASTSMPLEPMTLPSPPAGMATNDSVVCVWDGLGAVYCANLRGRYNPEWGAMPVEGWERIEGSQHVIDAFVDDSGLCALTAMHEVECWPARGPIGTSDPRWSPPTQIVMP